VQAILFLNRRGFAPSVRCEACGEMLACPQCAVSLTFHKRAGALLRCHYCEHEESMIVLWCSRRRRTQPHYSSAAGGTGAGGTGAGGAGTAFFALGPCAMNSTTGASSAAKPGSRSAIDDSTP
jgi:hypothetical protein